MSALEQERRRAQQNAEQNGMYLCPDPEQLENLLQGLAENTERYGYPSCPCRIATGNIETDNDIACPCDYRDPDVEEHGQCYCALYISKEVLDGIKPLTSIPERRPYEKQMASLGIEQEKETPETGEATPTKRRLLYCKQCGYVTFREEPPYQCPICKAKREMFAEIALPTKPMTREL